MNSNFKQILQDLDTIVAKDPATTGRWEAFLCSPGYHGILFYRLSHRLWQKGWRLSARLLSQFGRLLTGVEIHPGAQIGKISLLTTAWASSSAKPPSSATM